MWATAGLEAIARPLGGRSDVLSFSPVLVRSMSTSFTIIEENSGFITLFVNGNHFVIASDE